MRRRNLLSAIGLAAAWPSLARAQAAPNVRVGAAVAVDRSGYRWFLGRMTELGYIEGRNFIFDVVDVRGHVERSAEALGEVLQRKPDVILAFGSEPTLKAALTATRSVPIVMVSFGFDPLALGYVTSLARPTGNVTGLVAQQIELTVKRLQLVRDMFPDSRAAIMFWDRLAADQWRAAANAADGIGLRLTSAEFKELPYDYERAFAEAPPEARKILLVLAGPAFLNDAARLAKLALDHGAASFFTDRQWVDLGGLMSYGISVDALQRRAADYVDRIARGAKPSELPIEQPTKFELVINLRTAKTLGLTIPPALLVRADAVIE